jgi:hypothetical protein
MLHERVNLLSVSLFVLINISSQLLDSISLALQSNLLINIFRLVIARVYLHVFLFLHFALVE